MGTRICEATGPWLAIVLGSALLTAVSACAPATTQQTIPSHDVRPTAEAAPPELASTQASAPAPEAEPAPGDAFAYRDAETIMRAGLKGITQRYIDPIDMDALALSGLRGLATLDPGLGVREDADAHALSLFLNDAPLATFPRPDDDNDAYAWAEVASGMLRVGRAHSADLRNADNERVYEAMFDGMLSSLDVFSRYAGAEQARANRARRDGFGGVGVRFTQAEDGILITHVSMDGPAMESGLKPGDRMIEVNGQPLSGLKLLEVAKLLRGPVGSLVNITVARLNADGGPERRIDFNLQRSHIVPETVRATVADGLLILRITSFNKNTSTSVHAQLRKNDEALRSGRIKGLVMDLRGNPGGLLSQSVNVADLFLDRGRITATRGRHPDSFHDYNAGGIDLARGLPLVLLVDGESASAAEIVASALQDLGRAAVIGSASYGKGTVQTVLRLPNDGEMTLTWSRFVSPSGYALHGLGVMPTVCATNVPLQAPDAQKEAILAPAHIDNQRDALAAWRAAGLKFDGRRPKLRHACPARAFRPGEDDDLLMQLARRVINDPALYKRAVLLSDTLNTASR